MTAPANGKPTTFVITVRAAPGVDATRGIRQLLKIMQRRFSLKCISVDEVQR